MVSGVIVNKMQTDKTEGKQKGFVKKLTSDAVFDVVELLRALQRTETFAMLLCRELGFSFRLCR